MTPRKRTWLGPIVWMLVLAAFLIAVGFLPTNADGMTYAQSRHMKPAAVRAVIRKEAKREHLSAANTSALLWIAKRESNYHAFSSNHGRCLGVFQLSRSMCKGHPWWNPAWNTRRAIRYMRGRYGSPRKAEAFWQRHFWY